MATLAEIWRFPVKGISGERIAAGALTPEGGLAEDRRFAFAHQHSEFDPINPVWVSKRSQQ